MDLPAASMLTPIVIGDAGSSRGQGDTPILSERVGLLDMGDCSSLATIGCSYSSQISVGACGFAARCTP